MCNELCNNSSPCCVCVWQLGACWTGLLHRCLIIQGRYQYVACARYMYCTRHRFHHYCTYSQPPTAVIHTYLGRNWINAGVRKNWRAQSELMSTYRSKNPWSIVWHCRHIIPAELELQERKAGEKERKRVGEFSSGILKLGWWEETRGLATTTSISISDRHRHTCTMYLYGQCWYPS